MATQHTRLYAPKADWFSQSGIPDTDPGSANAYARRLVRYIADPSTVRARTLDAYGKAPSREMISNWRAAWVAEKDWRKEVRSPEDFDDEAERIDKLCASIAQRIIGGDVEPAAPANDLTPTVPPLTAGSFDLEAYVERPVLPVTYTDVLADCARFTGISVEELVGASRKAPIVRARQFAATVLRARGNSYPCVGRYLGDRDHSTIIHAVHKFFDLGLRDPMYVRAWMAVAPCVAKIARSADELDMLMVARP